ncbi:MAG: mannose-1-phosphate guanylyltransferase [Blastocatellia bacterium]|nr:mannose-1-phosphate guanylyltransferase [Blastocatellia bacterium]
MFAIVMAGGSGTRFWPASRQHLPKQFLAITSRQTMFEETLGRIDKLITDNSVYAVVNKMHEEITRRLLLDRPVSVLVEPVGRNTSACIGLAALHIRQRAADTPIVVLPSDHYISNKDLFLQILSSAANIAANSGIVTLGINPTQPETGYGYIEIGEQKGTSLNHEYFSVSRFVEKPDFETACQYISSGKYLWNSGIFIFTARTILQEIEEHIPALYQILTEIEKYISTPEYEKVVERLYPEIEPISIDYGVMEKTSNSIYLIPTDFGWSDVGSWKALYDLRSNEKDESDNLTLGYKSITAVDAKNNLVYSKTDKEVALLGVEGLVVVETEDVLLIADRNRSQDIKLFPEKFKVSGKVKLC